MVKTQMTVSDWYWCSRTDHENMQQRVVMSHENSSYATHIETREMKRAGSDQIIRNAGKFWGHYFEYPRKEYTTMTPEQTVAFEKATADYKVRVENIKRDGRLVGKTETKIINATISFAVELDLDFDENYMSETDIEQRITELLNCAISKEGLRKVIEGRVIYAETIEDIISIE